MAIGEGGATAVVWLELSDNVAEVRVCLVDPETRRCGPVTTIASTAASRGAGVPEIAAHAEGFVVAWRDVSGKRVKTARLTR